MLLWTITKNPRDALKHQQRLGLPNVDIYVARPHFLGDGWTAPLEYCRASPDLQEIRKQMEARGLVCVPRDPDDDPVIVESWM